MKNRYKTWLPSLALAASVALPASAATVDLLVIYDSYSSNYFSNQPATAMKSWVDQMNVFNQNSQVDIQWRLVGVEAHEESGATMDIVLPSIRTNAWVQQRRDALGADFVVQIHRTGACGIGYVSVDKAWSFALVGPQCGPNAMAHELGHNMGLNHSRRQGDTTGTRYRYGVGYGVDYSFVDLMAYGQSFGNAQTVPKYSNPNVTCAGRPCGVPIGYADEAFGAQALNNVKNEIAAFYPTKVTSGGTGQIIYAGQAITSTNGYYKLTYQTDGNLVLYKGGNAPLWASGTSGKGVGRTVMQSDGNLVIYNASNQALWASGTSGNPGSKLVVQDDGNAVIYRSNGSAAWATNTAQKPGFGNGRYQIQAVHSGKCIDVAWASTADGANIQQANCSGNAAQLFDVADMGSGWFRFTNVNSGKVLDVAGNSTAAGGNIQQWSNNGTGAQRFSVRDAGNGEFSIVGQNSGKCVDVAGALTSDGANIDQWWCASVANQRFRFYPK